MPTFVDGTEYTFSSWLLNDMVCEPLHETIERSTVSNATSLVTALSKTSIATIVAIQHLRRMRGGAQSHLMRCSDGNFYIVKFQNNPQHVRVLANEMLASLLARSVGL